MKIALCGGGTAGHFYPILAVVEEIRKLEPQAEFFYLGGKFGLEATLVPKAGLDFFGIPVGKMRRYFDWRNFIDPFRAFLGIFQSLQIFSRNRPDVLFAKGGFVSVPPALAARILGIPVVLHESDAIPGLANRFLARFANSICIPFLSAHNYFPAAKTILTGNPVRSIFFDDVALSMESSALLRNYGLSTHEEVVLVMGGSQGAQNINKLIFENLENLLGVAQVLHLVGQNNFQEALGIKEKLSPSQKLKYVPFAYLENELPAVMSLATLIISRAGAGALAEISALGKPSILIPISKSANGHQQVNAKHFAEAGAALVVEEGPDASGLIAKINLLLENREMLARMSLSAKKLATEKTAEKIAKVILARGLKKQ